MALLFTPRKMDYTTANCLSSDVNRVRSPLQGCEVVHLALPCYFDMRLERGGNTAVSAHGSK